MHIISEKKSNPYSINRARKYFNNMIRLRSFGLSEDSYISQANKYPKSLLIRMLSSFSI